MHRYFLQDVDIKNKLYLLETIIDKHHKDHQEERDISHLILGLNHLDSKLNKNCKIRAREVKIERLARKSSEVKEEASDEPFYHMFKRVCEELICPAQF